MNKNLKNIIAVLVGIVVGMIANMGAIILGMSIIDYPESVTIENPESIKEAIAAGKFGFIHYIFPFLAHAAQALIGAFVCTKIAASAHFKLAMLIGILSLVGGIMNSIDLQTPITVNLIDWIFAYIPMAWIGWKLASK